MSLICFSTCNIVISIFADLNWDEYLHTGVEMHYRIISKTGYVSFKLKDRTVLLVKSSNLIADLDIQSLFQTGTKVSRNDRYQKFKQVFQLSCKSASTYLRFNQIPPHYFLDKRPNWIQLSFMTCYSIWHTKGNRTVRFNFRPPSKGHVGDFGP